MFAPEHGVVEDPATGSSTGPLAAYMIRHKLVSGKTGTRFVSEQGTKMGRRSFLHVEIQGEQGGDGIYVGGHVTPIAEGVMTFNSPLRPQRSLDKNSLEGDRAMNTFRWIETSNNLRYAARRLRRSPRILRRSRHRPSRLG